MHIDEEEEVEIQYIERLRSSLLPFDWKKDRMLYGKSAETDRRHSDKKQLQVH